MMVNCAPAKCLCLPDLVPAQAFVRAGAAGGIRNAGDERGWTCASGGAVALGLRAALRFYRCVLPQFMPGLATLARLLPSVRAFGLATLAGVPSIRARPSVSVAAFALGSRPALQFWRGGLSSVCARHCGSIAVFCLGSRLLFAALRQTGRLAVSYVPVPPGRDRHSCVLAVLARLSAFAGSLRVWSFLCGDLDGVAGDAGERGRGLRGNGAGGAAFVHLCAAALALQCFPRGVRWGCAPQTAPKSLRLSGLSSRCGGVMLVRIRAVTRAHGKT